MKGDIEQDLLDNAQHYHLHSKPSQLTRISWRIISCRTFGMGRLMSFTATNSPVSASSISHVSPDPPSPSMYFAFRKSSPKALLDSFRPRAPEAAYLPPCESVPGYSMEHNLSKPLNMDLVWIVERRQRGRSPQQIYIPTIDLMKACLTYTLTTFTCRKLLS